MGIVIAGATWPVSRVGRPRLGTAVTWVAPKPHVTARAGWPGAESTISRNIGAYSALGLPFCQLRARQCQAGPRGIAIRSVAKTSESPVKKFRNERWGVPFAVLMPL